MPFHYCYLTAHQIFNNKSWFWACCISIKYFPLQNCIAYSIDSSCTEIREFPPQVKLHFLLSDLVEIITVFILFITQDIQLIVSVFQHIHAIRF